MPVPADKKGKGKAPEAKPEAPTPRKTRKKADLTACTPSGRKALRFDETPGQALEHARQELAAKKKAKKSNPPGVFVLQADLLGNK